MATPTTTPAVVLQAGDTTKINSEGKEVEIKVAGRYEAYDLTDAGIQAGIADGSIGKADNVLVKVGPEYVVYTKLWARSAAAMAILHGGRIEELDKEGEPDSNTVVSAHNYGNDLNAKRFVKQEHEKKVKGPEKTVNSTIKGLMALGYSEAEAEALAKAKLPTA